MANIFTNAAKARENTRNNTAIHSEIRAIESAVLAGVDAGFLTATVSSGTIMTDNTDYYKAYYGIVDDRALIDQIDVVIRYFRDLGYSIKLSESTSTFNTLVWTIAW